MYYRLLKVLIIIMMLFISSVSYGKTLDSYIDEHCSRDCADSQIVVNASKMVADSLSLNYLILLAIIKVESNFTKKARNGSSVGLMQVHLRYHRNKFAKGDPFNPYANIFVGGSILKDCMVRVKNNTAKSFRCYNGNGDPNYAQKVIKAYNEIKQLEIS